MFRILLAVALLVTPFRADLVTGVEADAPDVLRRALVEIALPIGRITSGQDAGDVGDALSLHTPTSNGAICLVGFSSVQPPIRAAEPPSDPDACSPTAEQLPYDATGPPSRA